ncbi:MAG: methylmalonyl-CoA epimerase [Clostridia bacterium]|nr:methylmalonyl-CoA epimerase [Clostridia bacterium]
MDIKQIDHIGIAVKNIEESLEIYKLLGLECTGIETVDDQKVKVAFLPCGESELELLEPTSEDSAVSKFIEKKGEGMHHIAVRVDNIEKALAELKDKGIRLIDETPRYGAGGAKIAFVHPKETKVLIELTQRD